MSSLVSLAKRLISMPSESNNLKQNEKILSFVKSYLKGFKAEEFEKEGVKSLLFYASDKRPSKFKIILNAHLDIVPGKKHQFKPKLIGNKLFGRGAYDMKAAAAVQIILFKELSKKLSYPLGLQLVTDEEVGGFKGTKYQIEQGVRADFVIAGEPTDLEINNKAKGIIWIKAVSEGKSSHGAYPWLGDNALLRIVDFVKDLENKYPLPKEESWRTTFNLAKIITTNESLNTVPDYSEVYIDLRFIPSDKKELERLIRQLAKKNKLKVEFLLSEPEHNTSDNNFYIKKLQVSGEKVVGEKLRTVVKHGGSDIRHYNQVGCEGITFGPKGFGSHTDNEWVDVKSLNDYYHILLDFLKSL